MMQTASLESLEKAARSGNDAARIELGNRLIADNPPGSDECRRGLMLLESAADGPQAPPAQWLLGGFHLQSSQQPGALKLAAHWLERAARNQVAPALDRLANLHLRGLGAKRSIGQAIELLQVLADHGFQRSAWEASYLLSLDPGEANQNLASRGFARACALGYPPAYYSFGLRLALGIGAAQDPALARALLLRAHDAGFPDAMTAANELVAESSGDPRAERWYACLKDNLERARPLLGQLMHDGFVLKPDLSRIVANLEAHFASLDHPALTLDTSGRLQVTGTGTDTLIAKPADWEWLSEQPKVGISRHFLTREERAHIRFFTRDALRPPADYTGSTVNGAVENFLFTGHGRPFGALTTDSVIRVLEHRAASLTGWTIDRIEPSSVIRYQPGQEYRPHVDYFSQDQLARNADSGSDLGGQRIATFLVCLVAPELGGETLYNRTGMQIAQEPGTALIHFNVTADGLPDELSLHTGLPVQNGEKWLLRTTLRESSRYTDS